MKKSLLLAIVLVGFAAVVLHDRRRLVEPVAVVPTKARDLADHRVEFVTVDTNVKLEVLDWGGTGRSMVLLTGLGSTAHVYDDFVLKLTDKYHVYGVTRRGFGASSKPDAVSANYTADRLGDDVLAVMDALKLERPILVGNTIAGEELSSIGSRYPEKVAGLVYLDAGYGYAFYDRARGDTLLDIIAVKQQIEKVESGQISDIKPFRQETAADAERLAKDLQNDMKRVSDVPPGPGQQKRPVSPPAIVRAIQFGAQKYTEIHVPVLAIFAIPSAAEAKGKGKAAPKVSDDAASKIAQANAFEAGVRSAHVVRMATTGHYIFKSNEADVVREMNAFVAKLPQ